MDALSMAKYGDITGNTYSYLCTVSEALVLYGIIGMLGASFTVVVGLFLTQYYPKSLESRALSQSFVC